MQDTIRWLIIVLSVAICVIGALFTNSNWPLIGCLVSIAALGIEWTKLHRRGIEFAVRENYLRNIFESAPNAKFLVEVPSLRIREANYMAIRTLSYSRPELCACPLSNIVEDEVVELIKEVVSKRDTQRIESYLIDKSGVRFSVDIAISPIGIGASGGVLIIAQDNSERIARDRERQSNIKHLEDTFDACLNVMEDLEIHREQLQSVNEQLKREITEHQEARAELSRYRDHLEQLVSERTAQLVASQEQLRKSERMASIGALAAGIAHEINNPIGAIMLSAQNALEVDDKGITREFVTGFCKRVLNHAERCAQIVKGVLQFAKSEKTSKWLNDINLLINSSVQLFNEHARSKQATVVLSLSEDLPLLFLNPLEIEQVFVNLLQNALDATPTSNVQITISSERVDGSVRIRVTDNGKGIPSDKLGHVFDPFFSTKQNQGGTGLGLSIVHGIVAAHQGSIEIASLEGHGTCVTLMFPLPATTATLAAQ